MCEVKTEDGVEMGIYLQCGLGRILLLVITMRPAEVSEVFPGLFASQGEGKAGEAEYNRSKASCSFLPAL
jgi:hypothetical protein